MEFSVDARERWILAIFALVCCGLLFSGYLSAVKLLSNACAFNEPCPYFLGYPACWYGFVMYLAMFIATGLTITRKTGYTAALKVDLGVSAVGIVFAGSFAIQELLQSRITGTLGLSTCAYGFIFYVAIFVVSIIAFRKFRNINPTSSN